MDLICGLYLIFCTSKMEFIGLSILTLPVIVMELGSN